MTAVEESYRTARRVTLVGVGVSATLAAWQRESWHRGAFLPAAMGAVLVSLSTIIVALNAQLLRRTKL